MFRATMGSSSGETTLFMQQLALVILYRWLSGMQEHMLLHTKQSSTQNNKCQLSHKHSCFSWWWVHSRPKHVKIDKYEYTKNKLCTKSFLFTRLYRDTRSTKQNLYNQPTFQSKKRQTNQPAIQLTQQAKNQRTCCKYTLFLSSHTGQKTYVNWNKTDIADDGNISVDWSIIL